LIRAGQLDAGRSDVHLLLARLYRETGNEAEAAFHYRKAILMGYTNPAREELSSLNVDAATSAAGG
jgi:Tfp pilus assembly protein PilF